MNWLIATDFLYFPAENIGLRLMIASLLISFLLIQFFGPYHEKRIRGKFLELSFKLSRMLLLISFLCGVTGFVINCIDITLMTLILGFANLVLHLTAYMTMRNEDGAQTDKISSRNTHFDYMDPPHSS